MTDLTEKSQFVRVQAQIAGLIFELYTQLPIEDKRDMASSLTEYNLDIGAFDLNGFVSVYLQEGLTLHSTNAQGESLLSTVMNTDYENSKVSEIEVDLETLYALEEEIDREFTPERLTAGDLLLVVAFNGLTKEGKLEVATLISQLTGYGASKSSQHKTG